MAVLASLGFARSSNLATAFDHFYNLEYDEAIADFRRTTVSQPGSAEAWNHLAQGLFYSALLDAGLMGSDLLKSNDAMISSHKLKLTPQCDADLQDTLEKAKALSEARLAKNAEDTGALYQLGVTEALRANYVLLAKHAWLSGLAAANQSRKLHEEVMRLDPANADALLIPGTHEYMIGTLPKIVVLAARAAGLNGDRDHGLKTIEYVSVHGQGTRVDARILLGVLYRREKRSGDAIAGTRKLAEEYPRNFLFRIELSKLYADSGDKVNAVAELRSIQTLIAQNAPGYTGTRVATIRRALIRVN